MLPIGASLWLYDGREAAETWRRARATVLRLRPAGVILHTAPDPADATTVRAMQRTLLDVSVSIAVPGNGLVALSTPSAARRAAVWAERCEEWNVDSMVLNVEGASAPGRPGWKPGQGRDAAGLRELARAVVDAVKSAAPGLPFGISSHDCPDWHRLPWLELLARADFHLPQEYTAPSQAEGQPPRIASLKGALFRAMLGEPQWLDRAERGTIPARVAPGGEGWWPAFQLHHTSPIGLVACAWRYPRSAWWCITASQDAAGIEAVQVVIEAHRQGLWMPLRALQTLLGVPVDGRWGPLSYAALRRRLGL